MAQRKMHLAIAWQSGETYCTGTLCGRENNRDDADGLPDYSTTIRAAVTCALCLGILANTKHWRYRKYLS